MKRFNVAAKRNSEIRPWKGRQEYTKTNPIVSLNKSTQKSPMENES